MHSKYRARAIAFLVDLTRRSREEGWVIETEMEVTGKGLDGVVFRWDAEHQAYGGHWTCGRVAAVDVARLLR